MKIIPPIAAPENERHNPSLPGGVVDPKAFNF
jgi:hypothetical protein